MGKCLSKSSHECPCHSYNVQPNLQNQWAIPFPRSRPVESIWDMKSRETKYQEVRKDYTFYPPCFHCKRIKGI